MPKPGNFGFPYLTIFPGDGKPLTVESLGKILCNVPFERSLLPESIACPFCHEPLLRWEYPAQQPGPRSIARIIYVDDEAATGYAHAMPPGTYPLSCATCGIDFSIAYGEGAPWPTAT